MVLSHGCSWVISLLKSEIFHSSWKSHKVKVPEAKRPRITSSLRVDGEVDDGDRTRCQNGFAKKWPASGELFC